METRWYLGPGQTLETTRIKDRGLALHVSRDSWKDITRHLDRNRLNREAIEKEISQKAALKKGSEDMTKNWHNSVENIRKRKEEERLARIAKDEQEKMERFYKLRSEQEALRQKYIDEAKKKIYLTKGHPKGLTSALILSEVLFEREKQLELEQKIADHEVEEEAKFAESVKEGAKQEEIEREEYRQKILKQKMETKELYLSEIKKKEEANIKKRQERIFKERQDIANMEKEFAKIKQIEAEDEQQRREDVKKEVEDFFVEQEQTRELLRLEELERDNIVNIYKSAKHVIDCMRLKKEEEMQKALQLRRNAAVKGAVAAAHAKGEEEERILKKALDEREQLDLERARADQKYQERLINERKEDRARFLKKEEQRLYEENEMKKWEMLNRFKTDEVVKDYNKKKEEKDWQKTLEQRRAWLEQIAEKEEVKRNKKDKNNKDFKEYVEKINDEDKQFFEYADEVLKYAEKKNRSTIPIERCINDYKRENNLPVRRVRHCEKYK